MINWDNMANWTVRDVELAADNAPCQFTAKLGRMAAELDALKWEREKLYDIRDQLQDNGFESVAELLDAYVYAKNEADMLMKTLKDMQKQKEAAQ